MAVAPPDIKLLAPGRDVLPNYVRLCLTVTGKTLAQRRDETTRFLAAEIEALRYAVAHRDDTIALTRRDHRDQTGRSARDLRVRHRGEAPRRRS